MIDIRLEKLEKWLAKFPELTGFELKPASVDASFRRYFRVHCNDKSFIAMDAPPEKENSVGFVTISKLLFDFGINVPQIFHKDFELGFFLISDLGNEHYLSALNQHSYQGLYRSAIEAIVTIQLITGTALENIPAYDQNLLMLEMDLFRDWYLDRHLGLTLDSGSQSIMLTTFEYLSNSALAQHQVLVHRDYHSRNLMTNAKKPGVLDFQDAVIGAFTYDLVSLLRDCYINWPEQKVIELALYYKTMAEHHNIIPCISNNDFIKYFDLMGIQRHLKAIGIFSRLHYRDKKSSYLNDIPRTLNYVLSISSKYQELSAFNHFLSFNLNVPWNNMEQ